MGSLRSLAAILAAASAALFATPAALAQSAPDVPERSVATLHVWYGTVRDVRGARLSLILRNGRVIVADVAAAAAHRHVVLLTPTRPVIVRGVMGRDGVVVTDAVLRWHGPPVSWPPDR
jgi:hypothetical protein